jgi:hypothetical protein
VNPKGVIATTIRSLNDVGSEGAAVLATAVLDDLANAGYEVREPVGPEARERLARHLFHRSMQDRKIAATWDDADEGQRDQWRNEADETLAVIAGKEN